MTGSRELETTAGARPGPAVAQSQEPPRAVARLGRWHLSALLGEGSLSRVYAARPETCPPDRPADYAVKVLQAPHAEDPLAVNLLRREAWVGRQLSHPHLVPILHTHVHEPPYYVVMPRLEGASVSRALSAAGRFATAHALWIVRQVSEALQTVHAAGWTHGDIKARNIIVSPEGHATLVDLGFVLPAEVRLTWDRPVLGTLHYLAPETLTSRLRADCRSDIYSLGVTLHEMLTGQLPFTGRQPAQVVQAHLSQAPPDARQFVPGLPDSVAGLLRRMMAKEPLRRPQSAAELRQQLLELEIETLATRAAG